MDPSLEGQDADEARPTKRARLDAPLNVTEDVQEEVVDEDGWDDIYGGPDSAIGTEPTTAESVPNGAPASASNPTAPDLMTDTSTAAESTHPAPDMLSGFVRSVKSGAAVQTDENEEEEATDEVEGGVPVEATDQGDELVDEQRNVPVAQEPSERMLEETTDLNQDLKTEIEAAGGQAAENLHIPELATVAQNDSVPVDDMDNANVDVDTQPTVTDGEGPPQSVLKPTEDAEFMAAAEAQKDEPDAEWQFDSSDAESSDADSDSGDSSTDDSDSDSEGGYEMLDPATAAKILMSGEGDDDDEGKGKNKGGADHQPRTANEVKEEIVPKPEVVVTEDMKITELGVVERTVENMVLVKGSTPGEYQVLESGSVLCNEKREVIGAIADTFGKVQEPLYSVAFTNEKEIEEAGMTHGAKVFYVDQHSTFVFTQPLKNLKGTDASNIHDEEVAEDEMEFSDDEAEAEYKRQKKLAKKAGRGGAVSQQAARDGPRTFGAPGHDSGQTYVNGSDAPQQSYGGGMSYDDEPADEFYSPLKRPDNLSEMMNRGGPPRPQQGNFDRGRGRGRGDRGRGDRGRGRGDRGRGRGGFQQDRNQRGGGRGGFGQSNGQHHRGNAQSFPDRHNNERTSGDRTNALPSKPPAPHGASPPAQQYPQYNQYQQQQQQYPQQQSPQSYQFNGYTFQYGSAPPAQTPQQHYYSQPQAPPQTPGGAIPTGAYINPAFFQGQQQAQYPPSAYPQGYAGWNGQQQQQQQPPQSGAASAAQQQSNLADILRNLGGQR